MSEKHQTDPNRSKQHTCHYMSLQVPLVRQVLDRIILASCGAPEPLQLCLLLLPQGLSWLLQAICLRPPSAPAVATAAPATS